MPYSQTVVVLGGLVHVPIIILFLKFIENQFKSKDANLQKT